MCSLKEKQWSPKPESISSILITSEGEVIRKGRRNDNRISNNNIIKKYYFLSSILVVNGTSNLTVRVVF